MAAMKQKGSATRCSHSNPVGTHQLPPSLLPESTDNTKGNDPEIPPAPSTATQPIKRNMSSSRKQPLEAHPMKIAILGTRGIPNTYGGFEQFAEYLAVGLSQRGHKVAVYLPHYHPYRNPSLHDVDLRRVFNPEHQIGSAANFLYDYLCLKDSIKRGDDIALECGYQSSAISYPRRSINGPAIITNMDGMEWKRAKWSPSVRRATIWFERLAVRRSHAIVADNEGIRDYLQQTHGVSACYIPYGAEIVSSADPSLLAEYGVDSGNYFLVIARLEPENNIETILEGYRAARSTKAILVIGNCHTRYGRYLQRRFQDNTNIRFLGSIYQKPQLDSLRCFSSIYFHGHSVGGTNPSLLEAMASGALIAAHDNPFNRSVIGENAYYFSDAKDIGLLLENPDYETPRKEMKERNWKRIAADYSWPSVVCKYEDLFRRVLANTGTRST